jgi:beta-glucosidase
MVGSSSADIRQHATVRVHGEKIPPRHLGQETRAVDFDDYSGVDLVDESKAWGDAVGASDGNWIEFADVDLGRAATFSAEVARAAAGETSIEIRLDDPVGGRLVGTARVASTGDAYAYATTTAALDGACGRHDVFLVFRGDLRLSTFAID